jgi:hypothetical protein
MFKLQPREQRFEGSLKVFFGDKNRRRLTGVIVHEQPNYLLDPILKCALQEQRRLPNS